MELIYRGEFYSHGGVRWEVEILKDLPAAPAAVGELDFPGEEPLVFEWEERGKEEPVCGSSATLRLLSPGDRTYQDLYTVRAGAVRLDVFRAGALYWSGTLDPEFYEEPYSTLSGYEVELCFSDFGVLDRLKFDLDTPRPTLEDIVSRCIERSGIHAAPADTSMVSLSLPGAGSPIGLADVSVRSDNCHDEEGEARSWREVLEGVLRPLALRIVQKAGKVWIYDLNGLYESGGVRAVRWAADDQMMGTDRVYNNAVVTYDPNVLNGPMVDEKCFVGDTPEDRIALNNVTGADAGGGLRYFSYHYSPKTSTWGDRTDAGFTLWTGGEGTGATLHDSRIAFFRIVPQYDGEEAEGVALFWQAFDGSGTTLAYQLHGARPVVCARADTDWSASYFTSGPVRLPPCGTPEGYRLRISVDMLMDVRFNPFEPASDLFHDPHIGGDLEDDGKSEKKWKKWGNFVYVPARIRFTSEDGGVWIYDNRSVVGRHSQDDPVTALPETAGTWSSSPDAYAYLCWYDPDDRKDSAGVMGWKKNRPAINPTDDRLTTALAKCDPGQYVPYPAFGGKGGELEVEICGNGWIVVNEDTSLDRVDDHNIWEKLRWVLMKLPQVEIIHNRNHDQEIKAEDVVYRAELNPAAADEIAIDTIFGTAEEEIPTARGAYYETSSGEQLTRFSRAGRTAQAEELLIGTLYSQFAERHTRLQGTTDLDPLPPAACTEAMQQGRRFILCGEVQDAVEDTSEAVLIELSPDEYDRRE